MTVVDFQKGKIVTELKPKPDCEFYGHMNFTRDGEHFLTTQINVKTWQSYIVAYDKRNFKLVDEYEFGMGGAHDLSFVPGSNTLAITSSGIVFKKYNNKRTGERIGPSKIVFLDLNTRKVVEEKELKDLSTYFGHVKLDSKGNAYTITSIFENYKGPKKSNAGRVYTTSLNSPLKELIIPENIHSELSGELLSIELSEEMNRIAVTNPMRSRILIFDLKEKRFLNDIKASSTGIVWDKNQKLLLGARCIDGSEQIISNKVFEFRETLGRRPVASSHFLIVDKA